MDNATKKPVDLEAMRKLVEARWLEDSDELWRTDFDALDMLDSAATEIERLRARVAHLEGRHLTATSSDDGMAMAVYDPTAGRLSVDVLDNGQHVVYAREKDAYDSAIIPVPAHAAHRIASAVTDIAADESRPDDAPEKDDSA